MDVHRIYQSKVAKFLEQIYCTLRDEIGIIMLKRQLESRRTYQCDTSKLPMQPLGPRPHPRNKDQSRRERESN